MRRQVPLYLALCVVLSLGASVGAQTSPVEEASKVRVLLVLDTEDQMGATWKLDGDNMKAVIETAFARQGMGGKVVVDMFVGKKVKPETVLEHYKTQKIGSDEALVFYYSGHGAEHLSRGHFMAFRNGNLYRRDLIAAMQSQNPRLVVVLTDCCANFAGGAWQTEPAGVISNPLRNAGESRFVRAVVGEPVGESRTMVRKIMKMPNVPRPDIFAMGNLPKPKKEEPTATIAPISDVRTPRKKAAVGEPASSVITGATLITAKGSVPLQDIQAKADGLVLKDLFFRSKGLVDINGCEKGKLSHGTIAWGGSIFTTAFLGLQTEPASVFDANGDRRVEWSEFFPHWQRASEQTAQRAGLGKIRQRPEATNLAK